jgi:hypothetical protein
VEIVLEKELFISYEECLKIIDAIFEDKKQRFISRLNTNNIAKI